MANKKIHCLVILLMVGFSFQGCHDINGNEKSNGDTRDDGCVRLECQGGHWIPNKDIILKNCKKCYAMGDPHFDDFSGARFDWQDGCNYALVQEGTSMNPAFGVFMDFKQIGIVAHVGGPTTYKENMETNIELNPEDQSTLSKVKVNGKEQDIASSPTLLRYPDNIAETTVYAWKHSTCVRLYGKHKILVELCESTISIWVPPNGPIGTETLGGLCGSTGSSKQLVGRDGTKYANPGDWLLHPHQTFGYSWKAEIQTKPICKNGRRKRSSRSGEIELGPLHTGCVTDTKSSNGVHHDICHGIHKENGFTGVDAHLVDCKYDHCMVANSTEHKKVRFTVEKISKHHREHHGRQKMHKENTIESVPEVSGSGNFGFRGSSVGFRSGIGGNSFGNHGSSSFSSGSFGGSSFGSAISSASSFGALGGHGGSAGGSSGGFGGTSSHWNFRSSSASSSAGFGGGTGGSSAGIGGNAGGFGALGGHSSVLQSKKEITGLSQPIGST